MNLKDAKIIVTGGSSGLGKATAELLIEKGAKVLITGRDAGKVESVAAQTGAIGLAFDIGDTSQAKQNADKAAELLEGVDALVNNAGIGEFGLLGDLDHDQFRRVFDVNVFGLAIFTQAILPHFQKQNKGHIINIGSTAAAKGFQYGSIYAASKFALRGMTQCWQAELRKQNIRVVLVNPSEVPTAFNQADRKEKDLVANKLTPGEIAHAISSVLEMDDRGFIPELAVWATNPWGDEG